MGNSPVTSAKVQWFHCTPQQWCRWHMKNLLRGPIAVSTQAVRKVWAERAQTSSAFQLRQFLESVTENVHSISNENTIVCVSPTAKHTQIQACSHMLPSYTESRQIKSIMSKHCTSIVVWGKSLLLPLMSCAPETDQDSRKFGLSACEEPHNVPVGDHWSFWDRRRAQMTFSSPAFPCKILWVTKTG